MEIDPSLILEEAPEVYAPSDDTWLLLEAIDLQGATSFCEVGTGTGVIALHASRAARTVATDLNPRAAVLARRNARRNHREVEIVRTDLFHGLRGRFDVIAFNPPYLPVPHATDWLEVAWSGGADGNRVVHRFLDELPGHLSARGRAYLLLSSHNEAARKRAEGAFHLTTRRRRSLFFEQIAVHELRPRSRPAQKV